MGLLFLRTRRILSSQPVVHVLPMLLSLIFPAFLFPFILFLISALQYGLCVVCSFIPLFPFARLVKSPLLSVPVFLYLFSFSQAGKQTPKFLFQARIHRGGAPLFLAVRR